MKILELNVVTNGSTGRIACALARRMTDAGQEARVFYGRGGDAAGVDCVRVTGEASVLRHALSARLFDRAGFKSRAATRRLIRLIGQEKPDLLHLHNLHGYWLDVETLFDFLRSAGLPVVWTLHDAWPMTGHCAYPELALCTRYRSHCADCPLLSEYPESFIDRSARNFERKRAAFTGVEGLHLVTPSRWLAEVVKHSYLGEYPVTVIENGISRDAFRPTESDLRERYGLVGKRVLLGCAGVWDRRKNLDGYLELAERLGADDRLVLLGLDGKQIASLPDGVLGLMRTESTEELAQWYTAADVFVDLTLAENFPTTHLEAMQCGTPVATYATGGSAEMLDETTGAWVETGDLDGLLGAIERAAACRREDCIRRAAYFTDERMNAAYFTLFETIMEGRTE